VNIKKCFSTACLKLNVLGTSNIMFSGFVYFIFLDFDVLTKNILILYNQQSLVNSANIKIKEEVKMIRPLADKILVRPCEVKEVKKGGIIIPDTAKEKPQEGEVVAVGTGKKTEDGRVIGLEVKRGDKVLFGKYSGTEVKIDDVEHLIMSQDDILGIIE
jgi:chaperonin GroES